MMTILTLYGGLIAALVVAVVALFRVADDMRTWREQARDYREMWHWERDQAAWLRKALEDERKLPRRDGVFR
jgi:hypothetical protein